MSTLWKTWILSLFPWIGQCKNKGCDLWKGIFDWGQISQEKVARLSPDLLWHSQKNKVYDSIFSIDPIKHILAWFWYKEAWLYWTKPFCWMIFFCTKKLFNFWKGSVEYPSCIAQNGSVTINASFKEGWILFELKFYSKP